MRLSVITTCKNRLDHLKQSLPLMLAMTHVEVIVVDYGCEQGTSDWVKSHHPRARVITITDDPVFHVSRARNIGAFHAQNELLCFVDADMFIVGDLSSWILSNLAKNSFYVVKEGGINAAGFLLCFKSDFTSVGGYDEALRGWAPEDVDLYERIEMVGAQRKHVPSHLFSSIQHGDDLRVFGNEVGAFKSRDHALALGALYRTVKRDLLNLTRKEPDLAFRKVIFEQINNLDQSAENNGAPTFSLVIDLGSRAIRPSSSNCTTKLSYHFTRNANAGA